MKYIRTKDKIEKVPNDYASKLVECPNFVIADAIEELCDEFVLCNPNIDFKYYLVELLRYENDNGGSDIIYYRFKNSQQEFSLFSSRETIYGAIWTDKGLIYVAKMNKEGELELL